MSLGKEQVSIFNANRSDVSVALGEGSTAKEGFILRCSMDDRGVVVHLPILTLSVKEQTYVALDNSDFLFTYAGKGGKLMRESYVGAVKKWGEETFSQRIITISPDLITVDRELSVQPATAFAIQSSIDVSLTIDREIPGLVFPGKAQSLWKNFVDPRVASEIELLGVRDSFV